MISHNSRHAPTTNNCLFLEELYSEIDLPVAKRKAKEASPRVYRFNPGKARPRRDLGSDQTEAARGRSTHNFNRKKKPAKNHHSPVNNKQTLEINVHNIDDSLGTIAALFSENGDDRPVNNGLNTSQSHGLNNSISNISHVDDADSHDDFMFCSSAIGKIDDQQQESGQPSSHDTGSHDTKADTSHQEFSNNSWSSPSPSVDVKMTSSDSILHPMCSSNSTISAKQNLSCLGKREPTLSDSNQSLRDSMAAEELLSPSPPQSNSPSKPAKHNKREAKAANKNVVSSLSEADRRILMEASLFARKYDGECLSQQKPAHISSFKGVLSVKFKCEHGHVFYKPVNDLPTLNSCRKMSF